MKDSGIPWIGEIPEGWETCRLKDCGYLYGGLTGKSGDDFNVEDNDNYALFIPFTNIYNNLYINPNDLRKVKVEEDEKQNLVKSGDLLFLMSSEDYEGIGKPSLLKDNIDTLYLNSFCKGFRISNKNVNPIYLNFLLTSEILRELVRIEAKGFIRINLRQDRLSCVPVMLPPLSEQEAIAEFLDRKCGEVDKMVSLQEQVIEELKAYKQSIITEAVTKGLNPNAPLKPSGIDWIGEIPEHWETARNKFFVNIRSGDGLSNELLSEGGEFPVYGGGDIIGYYNKSNTDIDELLIGRVGARCGCVTLPLEQCWATDNALVLRTNLYLKYMFYLLIAAKLNDLNTSNAQPLITATKVKNVYIPIIPEAEQREIADFLDRKCADIDALIGLKQQKIEDLREYKKSLIYEYVTGKKAVSF